MLTSALGYYHIRQRNVPKHVLYMHFLFFGNCLVPASFRLPQLLGFRESPRGWRGYSWIIPMALGAMSLNAMQRKSWY